MFFFTFSSCTLVAFLNTSQYCQVVIYRQEPYLLATVTFNMKVSASLESPRILRYQGALVSHLEELPVYWSDFVSSKDIPFKDIMSSYTEFSG